MPEPLSDGSVIAIKLGWLIAIISLLMGLASSSGVLVYQVHELSEQVSSLSKQRALDREAIISLTATLQAQGTLK